MSEPTTTISTEAVSDKAILFGRGRSIQERPSNSRFRQFVEDFRTEYIQSSSHTQRNCVLKRVIDELRRDGYTFLKPSVMRDGMMDDHSHWVPASPTEVHEKVSHLFRSRRATNNVSIHPSVEESGAVDASPSVTDSKKRAMEASSSHFPENTNPAKVPRLVSDDSAKAVAAAASVAAPRWGGTMSGTIPGSLFSALTPSLSKEHSQRPTAQDLHGLIGGRGGLEAYNQYPKVIPAPTDNLSVDDLARPRTIGYIKQPFLPSNPDVVVYRPVILLPRGMSPPQSSFTAAAAAPNAATTMENNILSMGGSSLYRQHQQQPQSELRHQHQLRLPSMMTAATRAAFLSSLVGQAQQTDAWLKSSSSVCRSSYAGDAARYLSAATALEGSRSKVMMNSNPPGVW
jgi:hypothetical protein